MGHTNKTKKKVKDMLVRLGKFIYGENTVRMSHETLFEKVGFPRHDVLFEVTAATWMHKIIFNKEPQIVLDYVRYPRSRAACKVAPVLKPNTTRFKRTAIASGIANYNKLSNTTASLEPKKAKVVIQKLDKMGAVPT